MKILVCTAALLVGNPLFLLLSAWAAFWLWFAANFIVVGKE